MLELVPCPACRRHVALGERGCPFCGAAIRAARAQRFVPRALTRAAVFSAALAACESGSRTTAPASAPVPQQGSAADDDLEKLLDTDQRVVEHPVQTPPPPPPALSDAGVPTDAAVVDATPKRTKTRRQKQDTKQAVDIVPDEIIDHRHLAKPYGAPPARRRVV